VDNEGNEEDIINCTSTQIATHLGMQFIWRKKNEKKYANEFENMQMR